MLVAVALLLAGLIGAFTVSPGAGTPTAAPLAMPAAAASSSAQAAVDAFIRGYMQPDGRVVRTDQGGDTVSEGQAYAMLMTAAVGERKPFAQAWGWTASHLLESDGLLAWHWSGGAVTGRQPATDADLGAAAALVMAAHRFSDPAYLSAARRIAAAVLAHETAAGPLGTTLLAGPWARPPGYYVDPSYLSFAEIHQLVVAFGGPWLGLADTAARQMETLTAHGMLPPDWAVTGPGGALEPARPPGPAGGTVRYGFDAVRAPIWMASSCNAGLRLAAAALLPALDRGRGMVELALDGRPDPGVRYPVGLLAEAAAAMAAGRPEQVRELSDRAARDNAAHPTYYGTAWIALAMLSFEHVLEPCP